MKVLLPITSEQIISIISRKGNTYFTLDFSERVTNDKGTVENSKCVADVLITLNNIDAYITKDGEKIEEILTGLKAVSNGNYLDVYFTSTILEEGHSYFVEITQNGNLYYRDKFYATSKTDFTIKHKQSQENYTEYNTIDDNTYIIK